MKKIKTLTLSQKKYKSPAIRVIALEESGQIMIGSTPDNFSSKLEFELKSEFDYFDNDVEEQTSDNYYHFDWE